MLRFPPKKILVPFDLADPSLAAWKQAGALARRFGSELEALYVEEPVTIFEGGGHYYNWKTAELKRETLQHIRSKIGDAVKIAYIIGYPAAVIRNLARLRKFDLIVMGTNARTGLERVRWGSVTESVVHLSSIPVLIVRGQPRPIKSVLAPVNFTNYAEHGLDFAAGVAAALKAPLTALHVGSSPEACQSPKTRLSHMLSRLPEKISRGCVPAVTVRYGSPIEEILRASKDYDLVVLAAHRKSLLENMVLGTTAERVIRHCRAAVLTVPPLKTPFNWSRWLVSLKNPLKKAGITAALMALGLSAAFCAGNPAGALKTESRLWMKGDSTLHPYASTATVMEISSDWQPGLKATRFDVSIPVKSLRSGESMLDKNMRSALKASEHPAILFKLADYQISSDTIKISGQLTIAGVQRDVELEAKARLAGNEAFFQGSKKLLMSDFGVKPPSLMFGAIKVRDPIVVHFDLALRWEEK